MLNTMLSLISNLSFRGLNENSLQYNSVTQPPLVEVIIITTINFCLFYAVQTLQYDVIGNMLVCHWCERVFCL